MSEMEIEIQLTYGVHDNVVRDRLLELFQEKPVWTTPELQKRLRQEGVTVGDDRLRRILRRLRTHGILDYDGRRWILMDREDSYPPYWGQMMWGW